MSDLVMGCRVDSLFVPVGIRIHGLRSDLIVAPTLAELKSDERRDAIRAARAGEPIEIELDAITFRQGDPSRDGYRRNANGVRFRYSRLHKIAKTFAGAPFLIDHRQGSQAHRFGTILKSEAVEVDGFGKFGELGFRQTLRVVKPAGVEGVLDGTIDRFSIGWSPKGPVICSVHGGRARRECACWPGDQVEGLDGKNQIVEYEFTDATGVEVSGVNVPAVDLTHIEEIRAALAREINPTPRKAISMGNLNRLATILGVVAAASMNDEGDIDEGFVGAAEKLSADLKAATTERDAWKVRAETAETALATASDEVRATRLESVIDSAYAAKKLRRTRGANGETVADAFEPFLRSMLATHGLDGVRAYVESMPERPSPVGEPVKLGADPNPKEQLDRPPATELTAAEEKSLRKYAEQSGQPFEKLKANHLSIHR
jgi:hypothetical protein